MMRAAARILAVIYAGFLTAFALLSGAHGMGGGRDFILNLPNALPWLLVWGALLVAWKSPAAGAVLFLAVAAALTIFFHTYRGLFPFLMISVPLIVISCLFHGDSRRMKKR